MIAEPVEAELRERQLEGVAVGCELHMVVAECGHDDGMVRAVGGDERQDRRPVDAPQLAERAAALKQAAQPLLLGLNARLAARCVVMRAP